jgi:hypothetical protein
MVSQVTSSDSRIQTAYLLGMFIGKGIDDHRIIYSLIDEFINNSKTNSEDINSILIDVVCALRKMHTMEE